MDTATATAACSTTTPDGYDGHDHQREAPREHGSSRHHHDDEAADDSFYARLGGEVVVRTRHAHVHRHGGAVHLHWQDHSADSAHEIGSDAEINSPIHAHKHETTGKTALLLILGSCPMVDGIPAFFAASRYCGALVVLMAVVFALSTIVIRGVECSVGVVRTSEIGTD